MTIYTITTIQDLDERFGYKGSSRCFGFYTDLDIADKQVRCNATDLHECLYLYAVIEKVEEGISRPTLERWFYKFNLDTREFEPIKETECMKGYSNFSIG
jgi:hypothetical protein